MTEPTGIPALSPEHRAYLNEHAIPDETIEAQGIRSEGTDIVFTWREDGKVTLQRRPWPGGSGVYFWEAGQDLHLNVLREPGPDAPILLAEGTKQSLAVASWAPPEYAVYGMPGCWGWTMSRHLDLARFAGRDVLIMLDADAADNLDVWDAGERLASELRDEEPPARPSFVPSPAWGKDGIDDYLARIAEDRRTVKLTRLIARAQNKPADKKPAKRKAREQIPDTGDRPLVVINRDRRDVIHEILGSIRMRWDGRELFCYGGALTRLRGASTEPLDKDAFLRWLPEAVACFRYREPTMTSPPKYEPDWPDQQTIGALLASSDEFAALNRVARTPFARPDGTICAKNGYDADTETVLAVGNSGMDRLDIPDTPSADDAARAARFLLREWLGDMPFRDDASRANALALVLTPFIRGNVPLVPLAVISGLQIGVGKNLLADCMALMTTGENASPLQWIPDNDDEIRKQILSAFRAGQSLLIFDEAHQVGGAVLSRALTALTYTDRILGVSKMASFPNQATWVSLGNQVSVNADMARRAYYVELYPDCPDPQDRDESAFRHPDLRGWTLSSRPELVTAALIMIRAWFAAGCPPHARGALMGSFEAWDKTMSGILAYAGVPGFLDNLTERRAERDLSGGYWADHVAWLRDTFGTQEFTVLGVKGAAQASAGVWDAPPGFDDLTDKGFARNLGAAYSRNQDRWFGPYRIIKIGLGHRSVAKWQVQARGEAVPATGGLHDLDNPDSLPTLGGRDTGGIDSSSGNRGGTPPGTETESLSHKGISNGTPSLTWDGGMGGMGGILPARSIRAPAHTRARAHAHAREGGETTSLPSIPPAIGFDLETAGAGELFRCPRGEFVRLAGLVGPPGEPVITENVNELLTVLEDSGQIYGHNILGFDGLALAWHHGLDWEAFAARARDTELIARQAEPPRSRESGSSVDQYDLDHVAERMGLPGKTDELKRLKAKFGGYDRIPLDDPEYRSYLEGDLRATHAVNMAMAARYPDDPYLDREHIIAAIAGRMTLNGFAVDQSLLEQRLEAGEERKRKALDELNVSYGLPLSRTITKGRGAGKHEEQEVLVSPLAADAGRAWLATVWEAYGVSEPPRTGTGKLAIGGDDLKAAEKSWWPASLHKIIELMAIVTTTRTVYQTAAACLAPDGRVHPGNSFRQASGRWSVTNPGLTVFGKRGGRHVERDIFLPDPGHVLLSCDLSQVDMRAMAGHSQDPAYRELFLPGRDVHSEIATQVFGTAERRQDAKAVGHGWNYGLGENRMIRNGMDPAMVRTFIEGMESRFPRLIEWRNEIRAWAADGNLLDNGFGRRMRAEPSRAYTVAPALMGQGGARDILCESLLHLPRELYPFLRVMVHDEVVLSVPAEDAAEIGQIVRGAFTWEWRSVPILCDLTGPGDSWGAISQK